MPTLVDIDAGAVASALREVAQRLGDADAEVVVNFASVRRVDLDVLRAMELLAGAAREKSANVVLLDVNVEIYKVLKLMKLASQFSFALRDTNTTEGAEP